LTPEVKMSFEIWYVLENLAYSLPTLLAGVVGLVMTSMFRKRSSASAVSARWCLVVLMVNAVLGAIVTGLIPFVLPSGGGHLTHFIVVLGRNFIDALAVLGLVYAVFQDRATESEQLPELEERHQPH
jgi:hypothetical protein